MRCPVCSYGKMKYKTDVPVNKSDVICIHPQRNSDLNVGPINLLLESGPRPKDCPIVLQDKAISRSKQQRKLQEKKFPGEEK